MVCGGHGIVRFLARVQVRGVRDYKTPPFGERVACQKVQNMANRVQLFILPDVHAHQQPPISPSAEQDYSDSSSLKQRAIIFPCYWKVAPLFCPSLKTLSLANAGIEERSHDIPAFNRVSFFRLPGLNSSGQFLIGNAERRCLVIFWF